MRILTPEQAIIRMMAGHTVNVDLIDGSVLDASIYLTVHEIMNEVTSDGRTFELFEYLDEDENPVIKKEVQVSESLRYNIDKFKAVFEKINKQQCWWSDEDFVNDNDPASMFNSYLAGCRNTQLKQLILDYANPILYTCDHTTYQEYYLIPKITKEFLESTGCDGAVEEKSGNSLFYMTKRKSDKIRQYEFKHTSSSLALQFFLEGIYK